MILKPKHYTKLLSIMCLTRASLASFSKLNKAYRPVILSKWFSEISTFKYEDHDSTILAEYIQKDQIKLKLVQILQESFPSSFQKDQFEKDYDDLIKEYFTEGSKVNFEIYSQNRFGDETRGKQNEKMKYFPTSFATKKIFQQANKCMLKKGEPFNNIFVGSPGVSKSISFSFLAKISNEINQYIFQNRIYEQCKKLLEADLITRIPKFIYWNTPLQLNVSDRWVIETLKQQFSQLNGNQDKSFPKDIDKKEIKEIMNEKDLSIFIQKVRQFYLKRDILIVPIIDQIEVFLDIKRTWVIFLIEKRKCETNQTQSEYNNSEVNSVKQYILKTQKKMRKAFNVIQKNKQLSQSGHCFFICSSEGQIRLMGQDLEPYRGQDESQYSSQFVVASSRGSPVLHQTQMNFLENFYKDKEVRSELFNYLIFQFDQFNNLKKNDSHKEQNQLSSLREFLDNNQDFKNELQSLFISYQWVPSQTTLLLIREMLSQQAKESYQNSYQKINIEILKSKQLSNQKQIKNQQKIIIEEELKNIFSIIQIQGQLSLIKKINLFVKKDQIQINAQRIQKIQSLSLKAELFLEKSPTFKNEQRKTWLKENYKFVQKCSLKEVLKKEYYCRDLFTFREISSNQTIIKPVIGPEMFIQKIWPEMEFRKIYISPQFIKNQFLSLFSNCPNLLKKYLYKALGQQQTTSSFYHNSNKVFSFQMRSKMQYYQSLNADTHKIGQRFKDIFEEAQTKIGSCEFYFPTNKKNPAQDKLMPSTAAFDIFFVKYQKADQSSDYKTKIFFYTVDGIVIDISGQQKIKSFQRYIERVDDYYQEKTQNKEFIMVKGFAVQFVNIVIGGKLPTKKLEIKRNAKEGLFYKQAYYFNIKDDVKFINPNQQALLLQQGIYK